MLREEEAIAGGRRCCNRGDVAGVNADDVEWGSGAGTLDGRRRRRVLPKMERRRPDAYVWAGKGWCGCGGGEEAGCRRGVVLRWRRPRVVERADAGAEVLAVGGCERVKR